VKNERNPLKERKQIVRERSGDVNAEWICGIDHKLRGIQCAIFLSRSKCLYYIILCLTWENFKIPKYK